MISEVLPYDLRDGWTDIQPVAQKEPPNALAAINYDLEYRHAMDAFRYIVSVQEKSQRAVDLTETIIKKNAGMFTVWNYRSMLLTTLPGMDLGKELDFMEGMIKAHLKGYQVWQHRKLVVLALGDPSRELGFCTRALNIDSKNYHTWAYRHWVLCHFWPSPTRSAEPLSEAKAEENQAVWAGELDYAESLLADDIRNNSAWAHRFFVGFENGLYPLQEMAKSELEWVWDKIKLAPNNASAWNYLRGILEKSEMKLSSQLHQLDQISAPVPCALATEFKADALVELGRHSEAKELYNLLATDQDPIRASFWRFRQSKLAV